MAALDQLNSQLNLALTWTAQRDREGGFSPIVNKDSFTMAKNYGNDAGDGDQIAAFVASIPATDTADILLTTPAGGNVLGETCTFGGVRLIIIENIGQTSIKITTPDAALTNLQLDPGLLHMFENRKWTKFTILNQSETDAGEVKIIIVGNNT